MREHVWICRTLSELGFAVEYVCICFRVNTVPHWVYILVLVMYSRRLEYRLQSTCILAGRDIAHIVFVAKLRRRRYQSTCTSSSLRSAHCICGEARKVRVAVDLHLVVLVNRNGFQT